MEYILKFLLVDDYSELSCRPLEEYQLDNQQLSTENNPQPQSRDPVIRHNRKHVHFAYTNVISSIITFETVVYILQNTIRVTQTM